MREQDLEIIKSRQLFLRNGVRSSEVLLADPDGGDSYLTFEIRHIGENAPGITDWTTTDSHHAAFVIDARPNAITRPESPIYIGTYGANNRPLYLGFVIQPQIGQSEEHEATITFYLGKEVADGANK